MKRLLLLVALLNPLWGASVFIDCGAPTDQYFTGGTAFSVTAATDTTIRFGTFSYQIPIPDGPYVVTLNFAEPSNVPPARAFSVSVNDQVVLTRMTTPAYLAPISRSFLAWSASGLNIRFDTIVRSAVVSSIQIAAFPATPVRERIFSTVYDGNQVKLPEVPQPATSLKIFAGGVYQPFESSNYITNWDTVTFSGWAVGTRITFIYFY